MYKGLIENKKAVFFDLDGTVIDSVTYWQKAFNMVANSLGLEGLTHENFHKGVTTHKELELLLNREKESFPENPILQQKPDLNALAAKVDENFVKLFKEEPIEPREGFWNLVYELKQDKKLLIALVSNSVRSVVDEVAKTIGLDNNVFDLIVSRSEVKHAKPHPEIYQYAAKKLKVSPKEVLVFEDSITGSRSSVAAGMDTVLIWSGVVLEKLYPQEIKLKLPDFDPLVGNLDETYMEKMTRLADEAEKEKQEENIKEA